MASQLVASGTRRPGRATQPPGPGREQRPRHRRKVPGRTGVWGSPPRRIEMPYRGGPPWRGASNRFCTATVGTRDVRPPWGCRLHLEERGQGLVRAGLGSGTSRLGTQPHRQARCPAADAGVEGDEGLRQDQGALGVQATLGVAVCPGIDLPSKGQRRSSAMAWRRQHRSGGAALRLAVETLWNGQVLEPGSIEHGAGLGLFGFPPTCPTMITWAWSPVAI